MPLGFSGVYWGYIGIVKKKKDTITIMGLYRVFGFRASSKPLLLAKPARTKISSTCSLSQSAATGYLKPCASHSSLGSWATNPLVRGFRVEGPPPPLIQTNGPQYTGPFNQGGEYVIYRHEIITGSRNLLVTRYNVIAINGA